jgi:hypothetical protein
MSKMDAFRLAVAEMSDGSAEELSSFIQQKYGVMIEPNQIVLFRATWLDFQRMNRNRASNGQKQVG